MKRDQKSRAGLFGRAGHLRHFEVAAGNVRAEVIAFCADLGQAKTYRRSKRRRSLGAQKVYVEDLRETFVKDHVFPMLRGTRV